MPVEHQTSFRRQKPASVMMWVGVTSTGLKTPLIFIEVGVKIKQHFYLKVFEDKVVLWVKKVTRNKEITLSRMEQPLTQPD